MNVYLKSEKFRRLGAAHLRTFVIPAARAVALQVSLRVKAKTPVWKGGLRKSIHVKEERAGMVQVVTAGDSVVAKVHEFNATWTKPPPMKPLLAWVEGKLGFGKDKSWPIARGVQRTILREGITLPNKEGKGQMFGRTMREMESQRFHFRAFMHELRTRLQSGR